MILLNIITDLAKQYNTTPAMVKAWAVVIWGALFFIFGLVVILIAMHKNSKRPKAPWFIP